MNLGIYVPEVARRLTGKVQTWVQEYDCCVRTRLGQTTDNPGDKWWPTHPERDVADEVQRYLHLGGFPFLDRFSSRDKILIEWRTQSENRGGGNPPRIVMAIILAERGETERARALLERQATEAPVPAHADYVRKLAKALGVENLDA